MTTGGVVAVGDSITNACSTDLCVGGVPSKSWAEWVAETLREPLAVYAKPGASSSEILTLIPGEVRHAKLALVFVGVNNIISWRKWRQDDLASDMAAILSNLSADQTAVMIPPLGLGRTRAFLPYGPRRAFRVQRAREIIKQVAVAHGALVIESPLFVGDQLWVDGVHPTSTGHLAMADAALVAIGESSRASDLVREAAKLRPDFVRWRKQAKLKFFLKQPMTGIGVWLVGR